jgi:hypothetical protein
MVRKKSKKVDDDHKYDNAETVVGVPGGNNQQGTRWRAR